LQGSKEPVNILMSLSANKNLEELFDLPSSEDNEQLPTEIDAEISSQILPSTLDAIDKIEQALPAVKGLEASDEEMDNLAKRASEGFEDLMNLGMQVDSRYASEIFSVASTLLGHAITAKTAKMNKKLKMVQLQLQKAKLDQTADESPMTPGTGMILDRNELLTRLIQRETTKKPDTAK
jgi:hypothetical protein